MDYLIFASRALAEQRSRAAYAAVTPGAAIGAVTDALWGVVDHPHDGRAALAVPATAAEAALGASQEAYDGLLGDEERLGMVASLPADWSGAPAPGD